MRPSIPTLILGALFGATDVGSAPIKTEIVQRDNGFVLLRAGEPYTLRGAGIEQGDLTELAARGGNSIRNWSPYSAAEMLDHAHALGITVSVCLDIARERHGFDYDDRTAVARQFQAARDQVLKFRDHPALLSWIIGNELNQDYQNPRVYDAVNEISEMIHELDPNHPTTTTTAGLSVELAEVLNQRAPDLDFLSIQVYGGLLTLPGVLEQAGLTRPVMITEWGARGHWEVAQTAWGAPIEMTSSQKADHYRRMHDEVLLNMPPNYLGNYVFLWAQKQERTPTWYGLFLESGESTEAVDVMQEVWTGKEPANRAPKLVSLKLDGREAAESIQLPPGGRFQARVEAFDPDGDDLHFVWELRTESSAREVGGDKEVIPEVLSAALEDQDDAEISLKTPGREGAYRLFVYVYDGQGHAAHANVPFLIQL